MIAALALATCKGGPGNGHAGGNPGSGISPECSDVAETVRGLYRSESTGNPELDADVLEANVHMVLSDCSTDPPRFTACIRRAGSVAELERDCVIPLDDEGNVEGRRFNN